MFPSGPTVRRPEISGCPNTVRVMESPGPILYWLLAACSGISSCDPPGIGFDSVIAASSGSVTCDPKGAASTLQYGSQLAGRSEEVLLRAVGRSDNAAWSEAVAHPNNQAVIVAA